MATTNELNTPVGLFGLYVVESDSDGWWAGECVVKILDTKCGFFGGLKFKVQFGEGGGVFANLPLWVSAKRVEVLDQQFQEWAGKVWKAYEALYHIRRR